MSGEGMIAARPEGVPEAEARPVTRPHVVGHMSLAGEWCVQLVVPVNMGIVQLVRYGLPPTDAEKLAAELLEYAALIREKQQ